MEAVEKFLKTGDGDGFGCIYTPGCGYGSGAGYGFGAGRGDGFVDALGHGHGQGHGPGSGLSDGSGYSYVSGYGILSYTGIGAYTIDGVQTIIYAVKGNIAKAATINPDMTLSKCYVAKRGNCFAHGKTKQEAQRDVDAKHFQSIPVEQRISEFNKLFPSREAKYPNRDFYQWHTVLTGSCAFGKDSFVKEKGIDLSAAMTVDEFILLTQDYYGGKVITQLKVSRSQD